MKQVGVVILCMLIASACMGLFVHLIQPLIDDVLAPEKTSLQYILPLMIISLYLVKGICEYLQSYTMEWIGTNITQRMQIDLYNSLIHQDLSFFSRESASALTARFIFDIQRLRSSISSIVAGGVRDITMAVAMLANLFVKDWQLALMSLTIVPLVLFPIRRIGRNMRRYSRRIQQQTGDVAAILGEGFSANRLVKSYTMEPHEKSRAAAAIHLMRERLLKAAAVRAITSPLVEFIGMILFAAIIFYASDAVRNGTLTAGAFTSFITSLLLAYRPIKGLSNLNNHMQEALAASERAFSMIDQQPTIVDRVDAKPFAFKKGHIKFDNVVFSYGETKRALHGVTLDIQPGQTVAVVGPSGAGKSSLLNLLPRFFDVTEGSVKIDGQDVRDVTLESLRRHIALVSQEATLLNDSIFNNIRYGEPNATHEQVVEAAKNAGAHDFIMQQENGYDTLVGENGASLSGGQRQRIAIARALLKDAPILLLDEATSSLDTKTERDVQEAVQKLAKGRTSLMIAHRLSTIAHADVIYVMSEGQVAEYGSHDALLAKGGIYAELWRLQGGKAA